MQLGFVIDHSRCIGCHACTVACKAENDVPVGSFRTWVKYTETGAFPEVRRAFAVLRCNQCTDAPCVVICPVRALDKRPDGIVDVDPTRCIGCKGCMQACPYDALYINDAKGIAEKCHFCAHRVERGLAPACAVVCPTEAIIPGDFHDPSSRVARLRAEGDLGARKVEAGTGPNVWYRDAAPAGLDPERTNAGSGFLWANQRPGPQLDAALFEAAEKRAESRTVYDVEHPSLWGGRVSAYLFTKSLAAGAILAATPLVAPWSMGAGLGAAAASAAGALALVFLAVTTVLLIADLKRPERFLFILRYANWGSWIARGTLVLVGYGALVTAWVARFGLGLPLGDTATGALVVLSTLFALGTASYTAGIFAQSRGRVLWMRRGTALGLAAHALTAGAGALLLLAGPLEIATASREILARMLGGSLVVQALLTFAEPHLAPRRREAEYRRVHSLLARGPFAGRHRLALFAGTLAPLALLCVPGLPVLWGIASILALAGLFVEQDTFVRAGQAGAIS